MAVCEPTADPKGADFALRTPLPMPEHPAFNKAAQSPAEVLFFGTCLMQSLAPAAGLAAMRLLQDAGVRVRFPRAQSCCGQPAYNAGFDQEAKQVARAQLETLSGDDPVVVPSASCAAMFRHHYPLLFAGSEDQARAEQLASRVVEFCEYLDSLPALTWRDLGAPVKVALHLSCSAHRELQVGEHARSLLRRLSQVEVVEPERATECCGFGGTFAVKQPALSAAITADKAAALRATGACVVVSQDLGCLTNLGGCLQRQGSPLATQHIAEFLWARVGSHAGSTASAARAEASR